MLALAPLALAIATAQTPAAPVRLDEPIVLELAEADDSGGPTGTIEYVADFEGTLYVRASGGTLHVEIDGATGRDDGSGGRRTPLLAVAVEPDRAVRITVSRPGPAAGDVELRLVAAVETDATRAADEAARAAAVDVRELRAAGEVELARGLVGEAIDTLLATPGADRSAAVAESASSLALAARELGAIEASVRANRLYCAHHTRTLPDDRPELQAARRSFAVVLKEAGELEAARQLEEQVLETQTRLLPADSHELQATRLNYAGSIKSLGDYEGALCLEEQVAEVLTRTLGEEHEHSMLVRSNMAGTLLSLGRVDEARALMEEVLELQLRVLGTAHPDVQQTRNNLAGALYYQGDLLAARRMYEQLIDALSERLAEDDLTLVRAWHNLGAILYTLGDYGAARELQERVLEVRSARLPDHHPELQTARGNLGTTLWSLGAFEAARKLQEREVSVYAKMPSDHRAARVARGNLANTLRSLGELQAALEIEEEVLSSLASSVPNENPDLQRARTNLAFTLESLGHFERARELYQQAVDALRLAMPPNHPPALATGVNFVWNLATLDEASACKELALELGEIKRSSLAAALATDSPREVEELASHQTSISSALISLARGADRFEPDPALGRAALALVETQRAAAILGARYARAGEARPELVAAREEVRAASAELARIAHGDADRDALSAARRRRESAQRALVTRLASGAAGAELLAVPDLEALSASAAEDTALVGYWRYERASIYAQAPWRRAVESVVAFVVRNGELSLVDVGSVETITAAVERWRGAILAPVERGEGVMTDDARAQGGELRKLVFDPLLPALGNATRLVVALDDVLHLVALDALPLGDGLLGESVRIELRPTLRELAVPTRPVANTGILLALGGASFNSEPAGAESGEQGGAAAVLRGGAWERGFEPLPHTGPEALGVGSLFEEAFGREARVLEKRDASRAALETLAPEARWLHLATHGWFAPESVRSLTDPAPLDPLAGPVPAMTREEQVRGTSPMLLCGVALAGANRPADALGRVPGLITAEEIAAWDLTGCELAVISACDTNVGVRRAGQGVASLQKALHMAGARSVVTSLWKVPDEATRSLMTDFYRRLWIERKSKSQALWEAKMRLSTAVDESGTRVYGLRDWAGWVLTGAPD